MLRATDTLARLGGDEFAVLLHDLGREPQRVAVVAERIAHKLLGVLQAPINLAGSLVTMTGSIGVTLYRDHGTTLDEILQQADMALFQAQRAWLAGGAWLPRLPGLPLRTARARGLASPSGLMHIKECETSLRIPPKTMAAT